MVKYYYRYHIYQVQQGAKKVMVIIDVHRIVTLYSYSSEASLTDSPEYRGLSE